MQKCSIAPTPTTGKGGHVLEGKELDPERSARRCTAILNYLAPGRPDLPVATRILPEQMSKPIEGTEVGVKIVPRYLQKTPGRGSELRAERRGRHGVDMDRYRLAH